MCIRDSLQRLRETPVLGQETITRMDSVSTRLAASLHDLVGAQVGLGRGRGANVHSLISHLHVLGIAVSVGVHGHSLDAHALSGLEHTASNLTTVGDQDLLEGQLSYGMREKSVCNTLGGEASSNARNLVA